MSLARQQLMNAAGGGLAPLQPPSPSPLPPGVPGAGNAVSNTSTVAALEQLTTEQLEQLLTDKDAFNAFLVKRISEAPAARTLADIQSRNKALAQDTLNIQDRIEQARNHLAVVKSSEFAAAKGTFSELQTRQAAVLEALSPAVLMDALSRDVDAADAESAKLMDGFMAGDMGVDAFVDAYVTARTKFHTLDLKRQVAESTILGPRP